MRRSLPALLLLSRLVPGHAGAAPAYAPVSLDGFADGIKHWRDRNAATEYPRYRPEQIVEIAENVLLYQRANGGWPANQDPTRILEEEERKRISSQRNATDTSFDNRCTYTQVEYLAGVYAQTGDVRHREACLRGLDFILAAQYPSGGWPHSHPDASGYRAHVTIADDVMDGILGTLRRAASGAGPFAFLDAERRARIRAALEQGDRCLLRLQVVVDGKKTAWAGQYDRETLQPVLGRSFELPALVSWESVGVVRYLMSIEDPGPDVVAAVEAAADWFARSALTGFRIESFPAEPVRYTFHTSTQDRRTVVDAGAPRIWARFYDIPTNRPFLANRDGGKVYTLGEVERERRTGYDWYGYWPQSLLEEDLPAWRARPAHRTPQLTPRSAAPNLSGCDFSLPGSWPSSSPQPAAAPTAPWLLPRRVTVLAPPLPRS